MHDSYAMAYSSFAFCEKVRTQKNVNFCVKHTETFKNSVPSAGVFEFMLKSFTFLNCKE